jgi:two-component system, NtrC family, response regulator
MADERPGLLIVEDDLGLQKQLKWCFDEYRVWVAATRTEALAQLRRYEPAVVLQDLGLPPDPAGVSEGLKTLQELLQAAPQLKVIVVTGNGDQSNAVKAVGLGATDFYQKPLEPQILKLVVARAFRLHALEEQNRALQRQSSSPLAGIIATDEAMLKVCRMVEKVAPTDVSVLILGESGTGKELLAHAIHDLSSRKAGRFVAINCAAIPEHLLESELFGHEKGAFTGAIKQTLGKVEMAEGGTLFLDEIGDMPAPLQAKLLRFLQDRVIERLGGRQPIPVNVRVVCATNQDLQALIAEQRFRQDLYYRISAVTINVPPLRQRGSGVIVLAQAILQRVAAESATKQRGLNDDALAALQVYAWPGNVRELENKLRAAVIMAEGHLINAGDLGIAVTVTAPAQLNLAEVRLHAERQALIQALALAQNNVSRAAELLGVSRPTLYDLLERCEVRVNNTAGES